MVMLFFPCLLVGTAFIQEIWAACQLGNDVIVLTLWRGELHSPGHSQGQYPSDQRCRWDIRVSKGSRVKVTFVTFDLEDGYYKNSAPSPGDNLLCNDVVKIEDGGQTVLFEGCQSEGQGRSFESTANHLSVYFISDESGEKSGFTASYEGICQSTISQSGFLESPGYPDPPPDGVGCQWEVASVQNQVLYIRPDKLDASHVLPDCGSSVLNWKTTKTASGVSSKERELCRADSKIVTQSDVILTYQATSASGWIGRVFLDYSTQSGCEQYCEHGFSCASSPSQDIGDYRCLCEAPYALGRNCEIYTNPCLSHNCSGAGVCSPVTGSAKYTCKCQAGYTGTQCEERLTPCEGVTCLNGGTCRADEEGMVTCLCPPDFTGTQCSIPVGEGHCRAEVDHIAGSGISWADTLAGQHDSQPCPAEVRGRAERHCMREDTSPTQAVWKRPDLSNCVSPQLHLLATQSQALRQAGVAGDRLYNVTRQLDNVTSQLMTSDRIYPGDLLIAGDVVADISHGVLTASSVHHDPPGLAQHFTSSIGNILDPETLHVWSNARAYLVQNKMASILTSAQRFAENLVLRQRGHHAVISGPSSSVDTPALLSTAVDNVELVVSEWGEENTSWIPPFPSSAMMSTITTFPTPMVSNSTVPPSTSAVPPRASLTLPSDLLQRARADGSDRKVRVYTGRFSTIGPLLSLKEDRYSREGEVVLGQVVTSDLLSVEVLDLPPSAFASLSMPVVLSFPLTDPGKEEDLQKYCVFMNMTASGLAERWLRAGCYVFESSATHVTCYCYHLTNFAVLMDIYGQADALDEENSAALSYISYIGGSLSIVSCVVVIVVFEFFRLSSDRVRIHQQLAVSIIAVQLLFFLGVGLSSEGQSSSPQCKAVSILLHYSLTALFCWMLVEGAHLYLQLVKIFKQPSHLKQYCTLGWGVPLLIVGISAGVFFDKYGANNVCWLNREVLLVTFVPTVSLVVSINVVILVLVLRIMLRSLHSTTKANNAQHNGSFRTSVKACVVLLPLLGLTWGLGFLAAGKGGPSVSVYLFTYLFTITNSCQGLLFFLFHCLLNVDVHNAYERRYRQRKRALSSLGTQTRKNSEASVHLPDVTLHGDSTTKTVLSTTSLTSRRPSLAYNRFALMDRHLPHDLHPARLDWGPHPPVHPQPHPTHHDYGSEPPFPFPQYRRQRSGSLVVGGFQSRDVTDDDSLRDAWADVSSCPFDDMQTSDTSKMWRRQSVTQEASDNHFINPALSRSPSYPGSPARDVTDFVTPMHHVLGRPARTSVRFSEQ